jgi:hypothetical protein
MQFGTQFTGTLAPNQSIDYFTFGWQAAWDVAWMMVPTTPGAGAEIQWTVSTQLSGTTITYWILVKNLTSATVNFQGRYAILNA